MRSRMLCRMCGVGTWVLLVYYETTGMTNLMISFAVTENLPIEISVVQDSFLPYPF